MACDEAKCIIQGEGMEEEEEEEKAEEEGEEKEEERPHRPRIILGGMLPPVT